MNNLPWTVTIFHVEHFSTKVNTVCHRVIINWELRIIIIKKINGTSRFLQGHRSHTICYANEFRQRIYTYTHTQFISQLYLYFLFAFFLFILLTVSWYIAWSQWCSWWICLKEIFKRNFTQFFFIYFNSTKMLTSSFPLCMINLFFVFQLNFLFSFFLLIIIQLYSHTKSM